VRHDRREAVGSTGQRMMKDRTSGGGPIANAVGAAGVRLFLGLLTRRERDAELPRIAGGGKRIRELSRLAETFAREDKCDSEAVRRLRMAARGRRGSLLSAAADFRTDGKAKDYRVHNRANALLLAAARDESVEPLTQEQERWFDEVTAFQELPVAEKYERIRRLQPELAFVERKALKIAADLGNLDDVNNRARFASQIIKELLPLVGVEAKDAEGILRSQAAFGAAWHRMDSIVGLA
jgi:hypothetical protein